MATIPASENEFPSVLFVEGAAPSAPATGLIIAYAKAGGVWAWKDDAGVEHIVGEGDVTAHTGDTSDAHDASAISFTPAGTIAATDVQAAIEEVAAEASSSGVVPVAVDSTNGDGSGNFATSSTSAVDVTGASLTITTEARRVKVGFMGSGWHGSANGVKRVLVNVDGTDQNPVLLDQDSGANIEGNISFVWMTPAALTAASHTFKIRAFVSAGTMTIRNSAAGNTWHMWVEECAT